MATISNLVKSSLFSDPAQCGAPGGSSSDQKSFWKATLSGGITGGIEACITYPTEYIKTMQQLYPQCSKRGILGTAKDTVHAHGVRGLYRGLSCLLFFSIPKTGVRFGSKEFYDKSLFTQASRLNTFLSGALAGTTEALIVVTPMETLKVKLIHDRVSEKPKYTGLFNGLRVIYHNEGAGGIYRGPVPTVLRQSSNQAIRFLVFGEMREYLAQHCPWIPGTLQIALAGGIAGGASVLGNTPIDVVKTNMQGMEAQKYGGTLSCMKYIATHEGVRGFYKGMGARLSRVVLDVAITFTLFEHIKGLLNKAFPN